MLRPQAISGTKRLLLAAVFSVISTSAWAVGCSVTQSTPEFIEMNRGGTVFRVNQSDLRPGGDALREEDLQERLTDIIQFRQTRSSLPVDDPDRFLDPGGPEAGTGTNGLGLGEKLFWCDADGNPTPGDPVAGTHMCSNGDCVISEVTSADGVFSLLISNARDCFQNPSFPSCNP
jgi:hypothetical protein